MGEIGFERRQQTARFHNPLKGGEVDEQEIEVRVDPLMRHQSIFNAALSDKTSILFPPTDKEYLEQRAEETKPQCFLCDGKWRQMTPRYPQTILPEGRLVKNDVVLFPNLFPLAAHHAVVMLGDEHFRPLNEFPASMIADALSVSLQFIQRCYRADPGAVHFTINANYLFPAGSSVLHPHLQILGSPFAGTHERTLLENSRRYFEEQGSCYWLDLAATEKRMQDRWLGELQGTCWFTAYAPLGVNEVNAITPDARTFLDWGDAEINGMAQGMAKTLDTYFHLDFSTFNFSCYSAPLPGENPGFRCLLRLINRQNVAPHYRADDYYFQKLLGNEIIIHTPEHLASVLRKQF